MSCFPPRDAETALQCPKCGAKLHIRRSCQNVEMVCLSCSSYFPLKDYIANADEVMENFLECVYCDRI